MACNFFVVDTFDAAACWQSQCMFIEHHVLENYGHNKQIDGWRWEYPYQIQELCPKIIKLW